MVRARSFAATMALMLGGCLPDLGAWQVVEPGTDAGVSHRDDAGSGQPNPIDLGVPCPSPHLLLGTIANSSETAHVLRVDPASDSRCRDGAALVEQRSFGGTVADVDWHAETGGILGLGDGVIALDPAGFPRWRYQPFADYYFSGGWVAAFGSGASLRIAVAWAESSSDIDHMMLLDGGGRATNAMIDPPFSAAMIAPHPAGSARLLIATKGRANIDAYAVDDATTSLPDSGAPLFPEPAPSLYDSYGQRGHIASDVATGRLAITHGRGVALWTLGAAAPSSALTCPSYCSTYQAAAPDPNASDGAYAICAATGTSKRHLVHLRAGSCSLVIDGTSLGGLTLQDIALARAPL